MIKKTKLLASVMGALMAVALLFTGCGNPADTVAQTCTVTFVTNGGSAVDPITVEAGKAFNLPTTKKEGSVFDGWYKDADCTQKFAAGTTVSEDTTLYAKWTAPVYTVTFNPNYDGAKTTEIKAEEASSYIVAAPKVERTGYTLAGWYETAACDGEAVDLTKKTISADTTFYAGWTINEYTVTFVTNGGSEIEAQKVKYNETIKAVEAPTAEGKYFAGWFTDEACTTAFDSASKITDNITIYAKWSDKPTYTVSFILTYEDADDADADENGIVTTKTDVVASYDTDYIITAPDAWYEIKGYTFTGWYDNEEATGDAVDFTDKVFNADATYYAGWTINTYTVTFKSAGEEVASDEVTYNYKTSVPDIALDAREGYTANDKWYLDGEEYDFDTPVTEDITLYAGWKYNTVINIATSATDALVLDKTGAETTTTTDLPDNFLAKAGDVLTVKLNAVAKKDIENLTLRILCNSETTVTSTQPSWGWILLVDSTVMKESITAKEDFEATVDVVVKADANGAGAGTHKVNLSMKAADYAGKLYTAGTDVDSVYEPIEYEYEISGKTIAIPANSTWNYQTAISTIIPADVTLNKTDTVVLTIKGCFDVDVTGLQVSIVDASSGWTGLSSGGWIGSIAAKTDFEKTVTLTITGIQSVTGNAAAHKIVLAADYVKDADENITNSAPTLYPIGHDFASTKVEINETYDLAGKDAYSVSTTIAVANYLPSGKSLTDYDYAVLNITFKDADGAEVTYSGSSPTAQVVMLGTGDWNPISSIYNINPISSSYYSVYCPITSDLVKIFIQNAGNNCASMTINYIDWYSTGLKDITTYAKASDAIAAALNDTTKTLVIVYTMGIEGRSGWGIGALQNADGNIDANSISCGSYAKCGDLIEVEFAGTDIDSSATNLSMWNGAAYLYSYLK